MSTQGRHWCSRRDERHFANGCDIELTLLDRLSGYERTFEVIAASLYMRLNAVSSMS
jgi:hypothetical protein